MDLRTSVTHSMPSQPWQRTAGAAMLAVSSACLLFTAGCFSSPPQVIGLKPESPGLATCAAIGPCPIFAKRESHVDSLRPTFRWERFPRTADLAEINPYARDTHEPITSGLRELRGSVDAGSPATHTDERIAELIGNVNVVKPSPHPDKQITAVRYELQIWKVGPGYSGDFERPGKAFWIGSADDYKYSWAHECRDSDPGELVYSKQGLTTPEHQLETPLEPDSRFFWTVRAHFRLDGKRRVTEWSEQLVFHPKDTLLQDTHWIGRCSDPVIFHLFHTP